MLICIVVFIHTFVIAKYRVAMDYQKNEVALRYMFNKITIPFDSFDAREGAADRATQLLQNSTLGANMVKADYLVLDNVYEEVCYQTSSKDLASKEDFDMLAKEAKLVSSVYKAKEKYDALNVDENDSKKDSKDDTVDLVKEAIKEEKAEKAEKAAEEAAEAIKADAEEAVEEVKEEISSEKKDSEEK